MPSKRIGLALAGGGPLGAIYEIGALCALEEAIAGLDLSDCHSYIGVSAGAVIAAGLANGLTPRQLCTAFIENRGPDSFDPQQLLRPAWGEYRSRLLALPALLGQALWQGSWRGLSALAAFERLGRALPTGLLSGDALTAQLQRKFSQPGRSNDFRQLKRRLVLVATDLDSGEAVPFGMPGLDHVPISRAAQASAALPGLFPPVEIEGRHFVDGALKKTIHASVLLDEGLDLLICLNPLVPYDASAAAQRRRGAVSRLADGGLPLVLSQTLRALIHSRLELGLKHYELSHPQTEILLFEPDPRDAELFLANTFSYARRRHLAEHAYQATRSALLARSAELAPKLARQGLTLNPAVLDDPARRLLADDPRKRRGSARLEQALQRLDRCLTRLEAAHQAR